MLLHIIIYVSAKTRLTPQLSLPWAAVRKNVKIAFFSLSDWFARITRND